MRIGLNLLYLLPGEVGGTETYAVSLLRAMAGAGSGHELRAYVNEETAAATIDLSTDLGVELVPCPVAAGSRARRYAYEQLRLPGRLRADRIDVLHSLGYVGPLRAPCPHVVTMHDLIYVGFRDHMSWRRRIALQVFVRASARRSDRVIAVSQASKREIVDDTGIDAGKVVVVHEAGRDVSDAARHDPAVLARYGARPPYVAAFSSRSTSKNISRLVDAFARIAPEVPDVQLALLGHLPVDSAIHDQLARTGLTNRIVATGYVDDADVIPLIASAAALAFPSLYEGFGLPVLDAQALRVPVACSDAASLPEVAGDGAVFFDPTSVEAMGEALRRALTDEALRADLVERGVANAARYSWERAAKETIAVYEQVAR